MNYDNNSLKHKWDNQNVMAHAIDEAEKKGEHRKAITIAAEMKKEGMPMSQITKFTGLSIGEIESL